MDLPWIDRLRPLSEAFADQSESAVGAGSALWGDICARAARDLAPDSVDATTLGRLLHPWNPSRAGDLVPLRVLAAAHRLALERQAPSLGVFLPTVGGTAPMGERACAAAYDAFVDALDQHRDRLPELLAAAPQTNEIGRGAALLGLLTLCEQRFPGPVRLIELGASAGLNLRADGVRVDFDERVVGPADSEVVITDGWRSDVAVNYPPTNVPLVVERRGVDLAPVDVTTNEGRLHLSSFVWPDQVERFGRLAAALRLADRIPAVVEQGDLVDFVRDLPPVAHTTVVWHSAVWWYLPADVRSNALAGVDALAQRSSGPVVEVALEQSESRADGAFTLSRRSWPAWADETPGQWIALGYAPAHGVPVTWQTPRPLSV